MAQETTMASVGAQADEPRVHTITTADLRDALAKGLDDFKHKPSHVIFLVVIYPIVALFLSRLVFGYDVLPLFFPLVAGFALVGPVAAIGLYELSRRREQDLEVAWKHAFGVLRSPSIRSILALGAVLAVIFFAWLGAAMAIYEATLGTPPDSVADFARRLFTTSAGWALIIIGNGVGFLFALTVLIISVVSFPMLIDRHVSTLAAVRTSIRACAASPWPMAAWGLIVAGGLVIGCLPFFIGLAVVMPILGHATWHLYRRVVER